MMLDAGGDRSMNAAALVGGTSSAGAGAGLSTAAEVDESSSRIGRMGVRGDTDAMGRNDGSDEGASGVQLIS